MFIKCDKKKVGVTGKYCDSAAFNSMACQFIKREMKGTCSTYRITKRKRHRFIQKSMRLTRRAALIRHKCIRVNTRLELNNTKKML
jgi:hypothetical protein